MSVLLYKLLFCICCLELNVIVAFQFTVLITISKEGVDSFKILLATFEHAPPTPNSPLPAQGSDMKRINPLSNKISGSLPPRVSK